MSEKYLEQLEQKHQEFYSKVRATRRLDISFIPENNPPLTNEEKEKIDEFWKPYSFAYPEIDYQSFQTFKNLTGASTVDVRHCPGAIRTMYFMKWFNNPNYSVACQNKALLDKLFPHIKTPKTIIRCMGGYLYDSNYRMISVAEAVQCIINSIQNGSDLIYKPSGLGGSRGIRFITSETTESALKQTARSLIGSASIAFVIQEVMCQHPFMAQFNPQSVNTIRVTSLLHKGEVHVLAGLIRVGKLGNRVDNFSAGGFIIGFDIKTGRCNSWAMTHENIRYSVLPSGLDLSSKTIILPNIDKLHQMVTYMHSQIPYIKMISWDIAIDTDEEFVLIENNFAGMIQIHEAVTGPLFGELMKPLLDEYLLKKFYFSFSAENFLCREYHDHISIEKYTGALEEVVIPSKLANKPVTIIMENAFSASVKRLVCSQTIMKSSAKALWKIEEIIIKKE